MFFIIKLILIILLNQTSAHITQDVETTILPVWKPTKRNEILLTLKAFGKEIHLKLCRNDKIASSEFKVWKHDEKYRTKELQLNSTDSCYYHHNDHMSIAVINICHQYGWEGFIFLQNDTLEIRPWRNDFASLTDNSCIEKEANISFGKLHLIIRSLQPFANSNFHNINLDNLKLKRHAQDTPKNVTLKLALFVDKTVYSTFMPTLDEDTEKFLNMIFVYINNIQALFHHPSLGTSIDILLIKLTIWDKRPQSFQVSDDIDKDVLRNSFCTYVNKYYRSSSFVNQWDVALYLINIDIYGYFPMDYTYMSASMHDTICTNTSCAIVEFGVDDYVISGFASSAVAAHEIGNILGMLNDEDVKPIPCKGDYIMSKYTRRRGQVTWSECSRNIADELWDTKECLRDGLAPVGNLKIMSVVFDNSLVVYDHSHDDLPGRGWNAKAQCEIYFHNKNANVVSVFDDLCQTLECEAPNQNKTFAGPALEGTYCDPYNNIFGHKKECRGGECVPITQPPYNFKHFGTDNWSEWKIDSCKSGCLEKSKGVAVKRRFCTHETKRTSNCKGPYYDVVLCDDSLICGNESRQTVSDFTEIKCTEFNSRIRNIDADQSLEISKVSGLQTYYDVEKPWIACVIFCQRKNSTYTPCLEMITVDIDPFFPDGTWCHRDDEQEYYCRQHYCLPSLKIST